MQLQTTWRTAELLTNICQQLGDGRISLGDFMARLSDRAFGLAILIFALPNTIPVGIPGLSSICALPLGFFAVQMVLGRQKMWLPAWIAQKTFKESALKKGILATLPALSRLEILLKPRFLAATSPISERLIGLLLAILSFIIFLPIPLGDFIPAICMCLLALGILERDGLLCAIGMACSLIIITLMATLISQIFIAVLMAVNLG